MAACAYLVLRNDGLLRFIRLGQGLLAALLSVSAWGLLQALLEDNFKLAYVVAHSEKSLDVGYKVAAFWAGQEGSLLVWAGVLGIMGALMAWRLRKADDAFTAIALSVMAAATGFFACVMLFAGNPFAPELHQATNGQGLNPQLQNLAMVFHPPLLFLGYAGFTAPFAYLIAGLCAGWSGGRSPRRRGDTENFNTENTKSTESAETTKKSGKSAGVLEYETPRRVQRGLDDRWLYLARPWMVYSWIMLTVGILLGAQWAYVELGWGGYWAWDPVENASLLPWLTGTALLHATILRIRRGIFKRWTAWLTAASFFLCILGTYLTRSGVIQSVHAFEESSIGYYFLAFMAVIVAGSVLAIGVRFQDLRGAQPVEALVSREGFFLIGCVLLVVMTVTTIVGTLFPLISQAFGGTPVTVSGPFYNKVILPMALVLAGLMATGPVLGSGAEALDRARGKIGGMLIAGVAAAGLLFLLGYAHLWALAAAVVVGGVLAGVAIDVYTTLNGGDALRALAIRRRHWGAQLAHLGLAAIVAGIAGSSLYGQSKTIQLHPGVETASKEARTVGRYTLALAPRGLEKVRRANHDAMVVTVDVTDSRGRTFQLMPERRFYDKEPEQSATIVALRLGILSDVYMTVVGWDQTTVTVTALINPLVNWIWIGGGLLTLGGLVCLIGKREVATITPAPAAIDEAPAIDLAGKTKRERQRAMESRRNSPDAGK
jgi:cytochrome c-type biogenesis protein CcmF